MEQQNCSVKNLMYQFNVKKKGIKYMIKFASFFEAFKT